MSAQKRLSIFVGTGRKYLRTYFILLFCFIAVFHQNYVNWSLTLWNVCGARFVWGIFFISCMFWFLRLSIIPFFELLRRNTTCLHNLTCAFDFVYKLSAWQTQQQFNDLNATPPSRRMAQTRNMPRIIIELLVVIKFHTFTAVIYSHRDKALIWASSEL